MFTMYRLRLLHCLQEHGSRNAYLHNSDYLHLVAITGMLVNPNIGPSTSTKKVKYRTLNVFSFSNIHVIDEKDKGNLNNCKQAAFNVLKDGHNSFFVRFVINICTQAANNVPKYCITLSFFEIEGCVFLLYPIASRLILVPLPTWYYLFAFSLVFGPYTLFLRLNTSYNLTIYSSLSFFFHSAIEEEYQNI